MSQEKVDLRKGQKGNRKEEVKKAKRNSLIIKIVIAVVAVIVVAWIGISIYAGIKDKAANGEKQVNLDSIQNYMEEIDEEINGTEEDAEEE